MVPEGEDLLAVPSVEATAAVIVPLSVVAIVAEAGAAATMADTEAVTAAASGAAAEEGEAHKAGER